MTIKGDDFDKHSETLVFKFDSVEAANHFKHWLCGQGEQQYWDWMECREQEKKNKEKDITVLDFDYWSGTDEIVAKCSRLDKQIK